MFMEKIMYSLIVPVTDYDLTMFFMMSDIYTYVYILLCSEVILGPLQTFEPVSLKSQVLLPSACATDIWITDKDVA
jgi:hypothetical protein